MSDVLMFDATKPPAQLLDTAELIRQLTLVRNDANLFAKLLDGWIADQNGSGGIKHFVASLANDSFASLLGLQLTEPLTPEEFQDLLGTLLTRPYAYKLKVIDGVPGVGTLFDVIGIPGESVEAVPELNDYDVKLHLDAHIRIDKKQTTVQMP